MFCQHNNGKAESCIKWKEVSRAICDQRWARKLKDKNYKTIIKPVLQYGEEVWTARRKEMLSETTDMRMCNTKEQTEREE